MWYMCFVCGWRSSSCCSIWSSSDLQKLYSCYLHSISLSQKMVAHSRHSRFIYIMFTFLKQILGWRWMDDATSSGHVAQRCTGTGNIGISLQISRYCILQKVFGLVMSDTMLTHIIGGKLILTRINEKFYAKIRKTAQTRKKVDIQQPYLPIQKCLFLISCHLSLQPIFLFSRSHTHSFI